MTETKIAIFIHDPSYGREPHDERRSHKIKEKLEAELGAAAVDFDIGPGWAEPGFLFQLADAAWPYLMMAVYAFFKGKDINDNLDVWMELYKKISPFRKHKPTFNREGAAVIAVHEIASKLGVKPSSLKLIAYGLGDATGGPFDLKMLSKIEEAVPDEKLGAVVHLLKIEFDGQIFDVVVNGNEVTVIDSV